MTFLHLVREEKVPDPTKRAFKVERWNRDHGQHRVGKADDDLHAAGLWVYARLNALRKGLRFATPDKVSSETMVRSMVALANADSVLIAKKVQAAQNALLAGDAAKYLEQGHEIKLKLRLGAEFKADEIIQGGADGLQVSITALMNGPAGPPKSNANLIDWDGAAWDLNMGVTFKLLEDIWHDCLWSGYVIHQSDSLSFLAPDSNEELDRQVVTEHREQNLQQQLLGILARGIDEQSEVDQLRAVAQRSVVARERDAKRVRYVLSKGIVVDEFAKGLVLSQLAAREPYYEPLLKLEGPTAGVTVNRLLRCWQLVAGVIELHWKELDDKIPRKERMLDCAPIVHRKALCDAVAAALEVPFATANQLVAFLTFSGAKGQDVWAQPLVALNPDHLTCVFHTARYPNLSRIVDIWLRQMGIDLAERGEPFEQYIRQRCRDDSAESPLLSKSSWTCDQSIEFKAGGGMAQLDLVIRVNDLLIIGESKCMLRPSEAREWVRHREKVGRAVVQVREKIDFLSQHREALRTRLNELGAGLPESFELFPVVVLNRALNAGIPVDGVAVVDQPILGMFFAGELPTHVAYSYGKETGRTRLPIYLKAAEAAGAAKEYFMAPPQMKPMLAGVKTRLIPIPSLSADMPGALQFLREVEIQSSALPGGPTPPPSSSAPQKPDDPTGA